MLPRCLALVSPRLARLGSIGPKRICSNARRRRGGSLGRRLPRPLNCLATPLPLPRGGRLEGARTTKTTNVSKKRISGVNVAQQKGDCSKYQLTPRLECRQLVGFGVNRASVATKASFSKSVARRCDGSPIDGVSFTSFNTPISDTGRLICYNSLVNREKH